MKALLKIALIFTVLFLLLVYGLFFVLTRPGVQKSLIEEKLPAGSSLEQVQITLSSIHMESLDLHLADGTQVRVENLKSDIDPFAAFFDQTIRIKELAVEGLSVKLPNMIFASSVEREVSLDSVTYGGAGVAVDAEPKVERIEEQTGNPLEALYQLERMDWLLEIGSIQIDGEVRDSAGSEFAMQFSSEAFEPGEMTRIEAGLRLVSAQELQAGLKAFVASAELQLQQDESGGFSQIALESTTGADDSLGNSLFSVFKSLRLDWDSASEHSELSILVDADMPRPSILMPEFEAIRDLRLNLSLGMAADGEQIRIDAAELSARAEAKEVVRVDLKQAFDVSDVSNLEGELIHLSVSALPLSWVEPWLPKGLTLDGAPMSLELGISGTSDGGFEVSGLQPVNLGPLSVYRDAEPLLIETSLSFAPKLWVSKDNAIQWEINELKLKDQFGPFLRACSVGGFDPSVGSEVLIPEGVHTETDFELGLLELSQQPFMQERLSLLTGRLGGKVVIPEEPKGSVSIEAVLSGLSSRDKLGFRQDYRVDLQALETEGGEVNLDVMLRAGPDVRSSTVLALKGELTPNSSPLEFDLDLQSEILKQTDLDLLVSAFSPSADYGNVAVVAVPSISGSQLATLPKTGPSSGVVSPPWSGLDGSVKVEIDRLIPSVGPVVENLSTNVILSEPLLEIDATGGIEGAAFQSRVRVVYSEKEYDLSAGTTLVNLDPSKLRRPGSGSIPVEGIFDCEVKLTGEGLTLKEALSGAQGSIHLSGRDGYLTALRLKGAKQLGLLGANLLGQLTLQPEINAMAGIVPHLKSIHYDQLTIELKKEEEKILIPELSLKGDSVLIDGSGWIAAESLVAFFTEPLSQQLQINLDLGAKGDLAKHLYQLGLLSNETTEDGHIFLNQKIPILGTVGAPDASIFERILTEAAARIIPRLGQSKTPDKAIPDKAAQFEDKGRLKRREEQILRNVETGVDILNSLFSN